jgi:hypothetical protein
MRSVNGMRFARCWVVKEGTYTVHVAKSSVEIVSSLCVKIADGFPGENYEILTLVTKYY